MKSISRRQFICGSAAAAAASGLGWRAQASWLDQAGVPPAAPRNVTVGASRLSPGAFRYAGSFRLPSTLEDRGYAIAFNAYGDSGRGSLFISEHFTAAPADNEVLEMSIPTPGVSASCDPSQLPRASVLRPWTDATGGLMAQWKAETGKSPLMKGLAVADIPGLGPKLFWAFHPWFNFTSQDISGLGYCDLDLGNARGVWKLSGHSNAKWAGYLAQFPQAWADQFTGGRSIISGAFIHQNIAASCGGAGIWAWAPWVDGSAAVPPAHGAALTSRCLADWPAYGGPSKGDRMLFPENFPVELKPAGYQYQWESDSFDAVACVDDGVGGQALVALARSTGIASWYDGGVEDADAVDEAGVKLNGASGALEPLPGWYPAPTKNGKLYRWSQGEGHYPPQTQQVVCPYPSKGHRAGRYDPMFLLFDLNDYAAVATGSKQPGQIRPYGYYPLAPQLSSGAQTYNKGGGWTVVGLAFDAANRRLFVHHRGAYQTGAWWGLIHVFSVGA